MSIDQLGILTILTVTMAMFLWGKWRHDMVAVACVLVLSRSLLSTGAIDALTHRLLPSSAGPTATIAALTVLAAVLSAFMNNVGTLALLMPVAIQLAEKQGLPRPAAC